MSREIVEISDLEIISASTLSSTFSFVIDERLEFSEVGIKSVCVYIYIYIIMCPTGRIKLKDPILQSSIEIVP